MFKVNVSPDMGMYHLLRSQGYDQAYAIAEFIDNALQAHLTHNKSNASHQPLDVKLRFYSNDFIKADRRNSLVIEDSGPGIKKSRLSDSMKPAKASPTKGLSEFGIGMKAAAVWFSDSWTLSTKPAGGTLHYDLTFDLPTLLETATDAVEVQERKTDEPAGTTIRLHQLRRPIDKKKFDAVCDDLRELYQRYTAGSLPRMTLTAYYNDTPVQLQYELGDKTVLEAAQYKKVGGTLYAIGKKQPWRVPVDMIFEGVQIEGFVCLLERGSYVDNPGLVMFRGERVIRGTARRPNLPESLFKTSNKYARQRVYGHLFADGLPVTYTKDSFEIDEDAFFAQLRAVDGMEALLRQAEDYRANKVAEAVNKESQIPGVKDTKPAKGASTGNSGTDTKGTKAGSPAGKPPSSKPAAPPPPPLIALLNDLKAKTSSIALKAIIEETIFQHQFRREIATALCMRMVLELAMLNYIERKHASEYPKVSEKGIKALLNYMNAHQADFFDLKADHRIVKCVQSTANGTQSDVVLLNNVAHGHYQPSIKELNIFAVNLEPLFHWAFS